MTHHCNDCGRPTSDAVAYLTTWIWYCHRHHPRGN
ncbi:ribosomal protein L37AE/L43A [Rhodococcus sp. BE178]